MSGFVVKKKPAPRVTLTQRVNDLDERVSKIGALVSRTQQFELQNIIDANAWRRMTTWQRVKAFAETFRTGKPLDLGGLK